MPANRNQDREAREARRRLRSYRARQGVHEAQVRRRRRDNVVIGLGVVLVATLATITQVVYFTAGPGAPAADPSASPSPSASASPEAGANTGEVPDPALAENREWTGSMNLNEVPLQFTLDGAAAPQAVASFVSLTQSGFYEGLGCHRLTTSGLFVLQCGDPSGDGTGGPGYSYGPIENAPEDGVYPAGTIAMARQGGDAYSQGSQFFIVYEDTTLPADAAGGYTVLGTVTGGLDQLQQQIVAAGVQDGATDGAPATPTTISQVTVE
jgi:peptidyl-prolyl cis-trans isomerase B (cyclophilin B)